MPHLLRVLFAVLLKRTIYIRWYNSSPSDTAPVQDKVINLFNDTDNTGYGESLMEDRDLNYTKQELSEVNKENAKKFKRGRMAFLFGEYKYAYKVWKPLAFQGYADAQATLAWMYHTGKGVKKNMDIARSWYEKAAGQNHPIALNNLGVIYEQGLGVTKSYQRAFHYYKESAEWGYSYAQYNLGNMYRKGMGTKLNINKAIYWLQLAALQGVAQAQDQLDTLARGAKSRQPSHVAPAPRPKWKHHLPHQNTKPQS